VGDGKAIGQPLGAAQATQLHLGVDIIAATFGGHQGPIVIAEATQEGQALLSLSPQRVPTALQASIGPWGEKERERERKLGSAHIPLLLCYHIPFCL
jgi:hypothetical protein